MDVVHIWMGYVLVPTATGHGSLTLGGAQPVVELYLQRVTDGPLVRVAGYSPVERVHQVGWVGLGVDAVGANPAYVVWDTFIHLEAEDHPIAFSPGNAPNMVYWDLTSGTTWYIGVYW